MPCKSSFLALDMDLHELQEVAEAIEAKPQELVAAPGFEATEQIHATFVYCGELLHGLPREKLAELHREICAIIEEFEAEPLPFKRFELFPPGKQNLIIARFEAPKRLVRLRRRLWRSCLEKGVALKADSEWLPHVTLGKLQASKAQLASVTCKHLEAQAAPAKPLWVRGVTLLGTLPKQLHLDWDESMQLTPPDEPVPESVPEPLAA